MNKDECVIILSQIYNLYSGKHIFKENLTEQDITMNLRMFRRQFKNFKIEDVQNALDTMVSSRVQVFGFGDLIGALKEEIYKSHKDNLLNVNEAWELVKRSGKWEYSSAKQKFNELLPNIQKVTSISFLQEIGNANNEKLSYLRKEFESKYKAVLEREKELFLSGEISVEQLGMNNAPRLETGLKSIKALIGGTNEDN